MEFPQQDMYHTFVTSRGIGTKQILQSSVEGRGAKRSALLSSSSIFVTRVLSNLFIAFFVGLPAKAFLPFLPMAKLTCWASSRSMSHARTIGCAGYEQREGEKTRGSLRIMWSFFNRFTSSHKKIPSPPVPVLVETETAHTTKF